ncbi:nitroreductase family protein [Catenulispora rubra]|uniref:nitroreductase family protein n=1 Tax=Catenulispora rubra TaxID=280293 RepID=UPI001E63A2A4|nr:nitroreductase family protein [Catenulispora rubra]
MEFQDVIRKRKMVRAFTTEPIAPEVSERLLRAANRAPSAGFSQGYAMLVLESAEDRAAFWKAMDPEDEYAGTPLRNAQMIVIPCSNKEIYIDRYSRPDKGWTDRDESRWPVPFWHIDTGMLTMLLLLAVVEEGLGALYFGIPPGSNDNVRAEFGIPADFTPIGAVAIGHPDEDRDSRQKTSRKTIKRRAVEDIAHRGRWRAEAAADGDAAGAAAATENTAV